MTALERIKKISYLSPPSHYPQADVEFLLHAFWTMREEAKKLYRRAPGCECELVNLSESDLDFAIDERFEYAIEELMTEK